MTWAPSLKLTGTTGTVSPVACSLCVLRSYPKICLQILGYAPFQKLRSDFISLVLRFSSEKENLVQVMPLTSEASIHSSLQEEAGREANHLVGKNRALLPISWPCQSPESCILLVHTSNDCNMKSALLSYCLTPDRRGLHIRGYLKTLLSSEL